MENRTLMDPERIAVLFSEICAVKQKVDIAHDFDIEGWLELKKHAEIADTFDSIAVSHDVEHNITGDTIKDAFFKLHQLSFPDQVGTDVVSAKSIEIFQHYLAGKMSGRIILSSSEQRLLNKLLYNVLLLKHCIIPYARILNNQKEQFCQFEQSILARINLCSILAECDILSNYFDVLLNGLTSDFLCLEKCDPSVFFRMGQLNFKRHVYDKAIDFLLAGKRLYLERETPVLADDQLFQAELLIAYSYEYSHQFELAIKQLIGIDYSSLLGIFFGSNLSNAYDYNLYCGEDRETKSREVAAFFQEFERAHHASGGLYIFAADRDRQKNRHDLFSEGSDRHEILHSLAHCLNELGIFLRSKPDSDVLERIRLIKAARAIMLLVASHDRFYDFRTCLFMIYGEARDYDLCLEAIDRERKDTEFYCESHENYKAECDFYKFLVEKFSLNAEVNLQLNESKDEEIREAYKQFEEYANERMDFDALAHIKVFAVKYEIAYAIMQPRARILNKLASVRQSILDLRAYYPSVFVSEWIRLEYNKTISAYEFFTSIFTTPNELCTSRIYDMAKRYMYWFNIGEQTNRRHTDTKVAEENEGNLRCGNVLIRKDKDRYTICISSKSEIRISAIQQMGLDLLVSCEKAAIETSFIIACMYCIIQDYITPQSIFILAPLTTAIPYQYQTNKYTRLFTSLYTTNNSTERLNLAIYEKIITHLRTPPRLDLPLIEDENLKSHIILMLYKFSTSSEIYYYSVDNEYGNFRRIIINKKKVDEQFNRIFENPDEFRHEDCPRLGQVGVCCSKKLSIKDNHVIDLFSELLISVGKYSDQSTVAIHYFANPKEDKDEWCILLLENGTDDQVCDEVLGQICGRKASKPPVPSVPLLPRVDSITDDEIEDANSLIIELDRVRVQIKNQRIEEYELVRYFFNDCDQEIKRLKNTLVKDRTSFWVLRINELYKKYEELKSR